MNFRENFHEVGCVDRIVRCDWIAPEDVAVEEGVSIYSVSHNFSSQVEAGVRHSGFELDHLFGEITSSLGGTTPVLLVVTWRPWRPPRRPGVLSLLIRD